MDRRGDVRALSATFGVAIVGALGAWGIAAAGCQLKTCDGDTIFLDGFLAGNNDPNKDPTWTHKAHWDGNWIDDFTWESNSLAQDWFLFPGQRGYVFQPIFRTGQVLYPSEFTAYLAPTQFKNRDELADGYTRVPDSFAPGAGNIAEFGGILDVYRHPDAGEPPFAVNISVRNDSCASYLVRVVVHYVPDPSYPYVPQSDAGDAGDSSSSDAAEASSTLDGGDAGPIDAQNEEQ